MGSFFDNQINFSAANEDGAAELEALKITENDSVLCITGSGARPLDLLTANPNHLTSIDFNAAQNHLLELKLAGYCNLDYDAFLKLIGIRGSVAEREKLFQSVKAEISSPCAEFWNDRQSAVRSGVIYCGTWEKLLRWISKTTIFKGKSFARLWDADDLESQIRVWRAEWDGWFLRFILRALSTRWIWTHVIREPGAELIPVRFNVGEYLFECLNSMAHHSLLRHNPFANLIFTGRYTNDCILPFHLQEEQFDAIKRAADNISIVTASIVDFLTDKPLSYDAFSLSDFSSYAKQDSYNSIWKAVATAATLDARYCERFFLVKEEERRLPTLNSRTHICRNENLENRLLEIDHTCLYSFRAGTIKKI